VKEHLPILILVLPLLAVPLIVGLSFTSTWINRLSVLTVFITGWVLGSKALEDVLANSPWSYNLGGWAAPWGIEILLTPFTVFLAGWIWLIGMSTWFYGLPYWMLRQKESVKEGLFNAFLFLLIGSVFGFLFLRDILSLYFCLETALAAAAALIVVGQAKNWRDGFYFFFWGTVGSSFLLLAAFFLYASTGTLNLDDLLSQIFISKNAAVVLTAGLLGALAFFVPLAFPLPTFFSRLVGQTPSFVMGLLSSVLVRGLVYLLFILLFFTLNLPGFHQFFWLWGLEYLLIAFLFWNFVLAFRQNDFQQSVAFLSVAQLAFLFTGFLLGNKSALTGTLLELLNQLLMMAGLFFIAGTLRITTGAFPLSRLAGLGRQKPWTGLALIIFVASLVGIPPTGGSLGKWYLIQGALEKNNWVLLFLVSTTVLLNLFYFIKLVVLIYEHRDSAAVDTSSIAAKVPVLILALGVLYLGIFHQTIIERFIEPALPKAYQNISIPNVPFLGKQVE
jgi:multicomponent Na+:H+ antiporter subunit D